MTFKYKNSIQAPVALAMSDSSSGVILAQKMHKKIFFGGNHCPFHVLYINSDSNLTTKISLQWHLNPIAFNLEPFQQVNKTFNGTRYMEHNGTYFSSAEAKTEHSTTIFCLFLMTTRTYLVGCRLLRSPRTL